MKRIVHLSSDRLRAENITLANDDWTPPADGSAVASETANIGDSYNGSTFSPPLVAPPTSDDLIAYANRKQWQLASGGFTATINGVPVKFETDSTSLTMMNGKVLRLNMPNPPATVKWQTGAITFIEISASDFSTAAAKVADFFQATFDALGPIIADIGSRKIATFDQVDSASWPSPAG